MTFIDEINNANSDKERLRLMALYRNEIVLHSADNSKLDTAKSIHMNYSQFTYWLRYTQPYSHLTREQLLTSTDAIEG
jgi:hypothetical protein